MLSDAEVRERVQRAESLLDKVETLDDEQARLIAVNAVQAIIGLYGEALARVVAHCGGNGDRPPDDRPDELLETLIEDELISHLLLVHDLHPVPVQQRVEQALAELASHLQSQGAQAEVVRVEDAVAYVRVSENCGGCGSAGQNAAGGNLKTTIENAVLQAAPELLRVQMVGEASGPMGLDAAAPGTSGSGFIPLNTLQPTKESDRRG